MAITVTVVDTLIYHHFFISHTKKLQTTKAHQTNCFTWPLKWSVKHNFIGEGNYDFRPHRTHGTNAAYCYTYVCISGVFRIL